MKTSTLVALALLVGSLGTVVASSPVSAATEAALAPGTGQYRLICETGRKYQTIVEVANVAGINTGGVTFSTSDAFGTTTSKPRPYSTNNVQARFQQTRGGNVYVFAQYITNNDLMLHNISFNGQDLVTVKVKSCL